MDKVASERLWWPMNRQNRKFRNQCTHFWFVILIAIGCGQQPVREIPKETRSATPEEKRQGPASALESDIPEKSSRSK